MENKKKNSDLEKTLEDISNKDFFACDEKTRLEKLTIADYNLAIFDYTNYILENMILGSDVLFSMLETFIEFKETDSNKMIFLAYLLNKYYPSVLVEKLDESISEEDYELSAELRDLLKINEIPTNRI